MTVRIQITGWAVPLWFAFLAITTIHAIAQPPNRWKNFTTENGLPSDTPSQVVLDGNGFLWVMVGKPSRFDGYTFKNYTRDSITLVDDMHVDDEGTLWLNLWRNGKIVRYDFDTDKFIFYQASTGYHNSWGSISGNKNQLWIGTSDGLYSFTSHADSLQKYVNPHEDSVTQALQNFYLDIVDNGAELLCGTRLGLWKFNKTNHSFSRPPITKSDSLHLLHSQVGKIFKDEDNYWFAVHRIKGALVKTDSKLAVTEEFEMPIGLSIDFGQGAFWINKPDTIIRFDLTSKNFTLYMNEPANSHSLPISHSIYGRYLNIDRDQNAWMTVGEKGLLLLRKSAAGFKTYTPGDKPHVTGITFLSIGYNYHLIVSTNGEGIWIAPITAKNPDQLIFEPLQIDGMIEDLRFVNKIEKSKDGLWVVTYTDQIVKLSMLAREEKIIGKVVKVLRNDPATQNPIINDRLYTFKEDREGNLWVGTFLGLTIVTLNKDGNIDNVQRFTNDPSDSTSITRGAVWDICFENQPILVSTGWLNEYHDGQFKRVSWSSGVMRKSMKGTLWIGTGGGLDEIKQDQEGYHYIRVEWLRDKWIQAIEEDPIGRLWVSTRGHGLFCYDPKEQTATQFKVEDGIQGNAFNHQGSGNAPDGWLAFSGGDGVTVFNPVSYQVSQEKPRLYITQLKVNNREARVEGQPVEDGDFVIPQSITALSQLVLTHQQNILNLEFAAIEFYDPQKIKYAYKLEGFDQGWVYTDWKNRVATYTNLYAGEYVFKVKATNSDGIWSNQERTLTITVLPPPWRTWWAYTGYSLLVVGLLFGARRLIVQRERYKASMQLEHVELEKAKEVDRVKTSFFTNISHEFRTPLTLIKGPVQNLMEEFANNPKVTERLKLVERNSDLLLKLINQLLDLAKLDAGNLKVEMSKGEVLRFVKATSSSFSSLAAQKHVSITIDVSTETCYAFFDRDKLETILINLINNAIKFTPSHGIVQISAQIDSGSLRISVKDTGIGIPADQHEKVFERFHQVSESHKEVGTGIGLALVKELASLLGGTIAVKSEVGKGSEFVVTLPLEIVSSEDRLETSDHEVSIERPTVHVVQDRIALKGGTSNGEDKRPHILVVEDNADLRSFIIESLGEEFHFLEAENGKQGLDIATSEIPDLIISDVMMPEMDGITMAEKIKTDVRTSHIPLILLTAKSTEASKLTGLESGADDYLTKPFNKHELLLKIKNGISRQRRLREKVMAELMSEAPRKEVLSADEQFLAKVKDEILKQMSDEQLSVESLAEQIGMSRVHLYRKISGLTGMSVNELIRKLRLHRAAQLLQQQWGPVSQVAYEVGFSNLSYFSKVFKEEFGTLPSEYNGVNSPSKT